MPRCRYCREWLPQDRERVGARCPYCREALDDERRRFRAGQVAGVCAAHAANVAVGTCQRCGNYLCDVCSSRWQGRSLCVACVARALEERDVHPDELRAHLRQGVLAVVFGVLAWVLTGLSFLCVVGFLGDVQEGLAMLLALVFVFLFAVSFLLGAVGVGHGAAAIRARGHHMVLATIGLLLSGLHVGILIGLLTIQVFREG